MTLFSVRGREELLGVRFATSPLWESLIAVRTLVDERSGAYHAPWHAAVRERLARVPLAELLATQPRVGYVPDFLTPPPRGPSPRLRDQLAELRATPPGQAAAELRRCRLSLGASSGEAAAILERLEADPAAAVRLLADRLHDVWRELIAPFWPRLRSLVDGDVDQRSRTLARHGLRRLFDDLHPRIRWRDGGVWIDDGEPATVELDARGLLLMPSAYLAPAVVAIVDEPWQPTIVYPARGLAELWREAPAPPDALARLLGATRALVLTTLDRPLSTTTLAALTELSPAGVSRHLLALRDAGLLSSTRRGHEVRYARTALGTSLVRGAG